MKDEPDRPSFYVTSVEGIKDTQRRHALLRAVGDALPKIKEYSALVFPASVDHDIFLDHVVGRVVAADAETPVRNYRAYLLQSLMNEARRLLRRASKFEYLDPEELADHPATSDALAVDKLEAKILTEEALAILDQRTRKICVLWSQGYKPKDIGTIVGMKPRAVQKQLERGLARMRRFAQSGPKNEPGPTY